jgi:predicted patatin/cPLA2 family phospholipase
MVYYMSGLSDDVEIFYKKVRPTNPIIKQILEVLDATGKLPKKHTGEVTIKINMNDGGVSESTLSVTEKLK